MQDVKVRITTCIYCIRIARMSPDPQAVDSTIYCERSLDRFDSPSIFARTPPEAPRLNCVFCTTLIMLSPGLVARRRARVSSVLVHLHGKYL